MSLRSQKEMDKYFMHQAIGDAEKAFAADEAPVSVVIASHNKIIARAHNQVELLKDPTAHAEMIAIKGLFRF